MFCFLFIDFQNITRYLEQNRESIYICGRWNYYVEKVSKIYMVNMWKVKSWFWAYTLEFSNKSLCVLYVKAFRLSQMSVTFTRHSFTIWTTFCRQIFYTKLVQFEVFLLCASRPFLYDSVASLVLKQMQSRLLKHES